MLLSDVHGQTQPVGMGTTGLYPQFYLRLVGNHCLLGRFRLDLFSLLFGYDENSLCWTRFIIPLLWVLDDCSVGVSGLERKQIIDILYLGFGFLLLLLLFFLWFHSAQPGVFNPVSLYFSSSKWPFFFFFPLEASKNTYIVCSRLDDWCMSWCTLFILPIYFMFSLHFYFLPCGRLTAYCSGQGVVYYFLVWWCRGVVCARRKLTLEEL